MKRSIKRSALVVLIPALLFLSGMPRVRASDTNLSLEKGKQMFFATVDRFFNATANSEQVRSGLDLSSGLFALMEDSCQRYYWQARVEYIYGFVEQGDNRKKEAKDRYLQSQSLIMKALECEQFSEGYRLLADTYAQLLNYNGLGYTIQYGPKIMELSRKAIRLDPGNVKAYLTLALSYMFAPPIAGGDINRCIRILHSLESMDTEEREDRFSVYVWLAKAYAEKKDGKLAEHYLGSALSVYPGNSWVREMIKN